MSPGDLLVEAFVAYGREKLEFLADHHGEPEFDTWPSPFLSWVRSQADLFVLSDPLETWIDPTQFGDPDLPSYARVLSAMDADPWTASQVDTLIGSGLSGAGRVELRQALTLWLVRENVVRTRTYVADEAILRERAAALAAAYRAKELEIVELVPLHGFAANIADDSFAVESTVVRRMTDDELSICLSIGGVPTQDEMYGARTVDAQNQWCVERRHRVPKHVGEGSLPARPASDLDDVADRFVTACRVVVGGAPDRGSTIRMRPSGSLAGATGLSWQRRKPMRPEELSPAVIRPEDIENVVGFAALLRARAVSRHRPCKSR